MPRRYKFALVVCACLALTAAVLGPIVAIRVLASSDASKQRANVRITGLQEQITRLQSQVTDAATLAAQLRIIVDALSDQLRQLGAVPVVTNPTTTPPTGSSPTTVPTTTTTTQACKVTVLDRCLVGVKP